MTEKIKHIFLHILDATSVARRVVLAAADYSLAVVRCRHDVLREIENRSGNRQRKETNLKRKPRAIATSGC